VGTADKNDDIEEFLRDETPPNKVRPPKTSRKIRESLGKELLLSD
jgi:hypothetical protein